MDAWIAVGGPRPPGSAGPGGWDWWPLLGAAAILLILLSSRWRPPFALTVFLAAIGGLVLGALTDTWGVTPVWATLLLVVLSRYLIRGRRAPDV